MKIKVQRVYEAYLKGIGHTPEDAKQFALLRWEEIIAIESRLLKQGHPASVAHSDAIAQWEHERDMNPKHREKVFRWMR